jgi:hypothetical protein
MYDLRFYSEYFFRARPHLVNWTTITDANGQYGGLSGYPLYSSPRVLTGHEGCGVSLLSGPRFSKPETLLQALSAPDCSDILFCEGVAETKKIERKAGKGAPKKK